MNADVSELFVPLEHMSSAVYIEDEAGSSEMAPFCRGEHVSLGDEVTLAPLNLRS